MKDYSLMGKLVRVFDQYERVVEPGTGGRDKVRWKRVAPKDITGWVTGYRTVHNGYIHDGGGYGEDYEPSYFVPKEPVPCLLVVYNPRHNPFKVPLDSVEVIEEVVT